MRPFVKWAGGKKQILPLIIDHIRKSAAHNGKKDYTFIEPFVGGGVVFINLKNKRTIINDLNKELITAYRVVRNQPEELMWLLDQMHDAFQLDRENYYREVRNIDREPQYNELDDLHIAARMIFLNKTCFNGLYRVNSEGFFNTPLGRNNIRNFYDKDNILSLSKYLRTIPEENIMNGSYKFAMRRAKIGDILYVDPPYDYTENDGFTQYQKEGFTLEDLKELKEECDKVLDVEGYVIISNNDTKAVRKAFENDAKHDYSFYFIEKLDTKRLINCKGTLRNTGKEILIIGMPCVFPQISDVNRMLQYIRVRDENLLKDEDELIKRFKVTKLRAGQMLSTMRYFGIINGDYSFTEKGKMLRKINKNKYPRAVRELILEKQLFKKVFEHDYKDTSMKYSQEEIRDIIIRETEEISSTMANKRASIVRKIIDWCVAN